MGQLLGIRRSWLFLGLLVACLALTWIVAVPDALSPLSYIVFAALATALAGVVMMTVHNAHATGHVAQLIHEADVAAVSSGSVSRGTHEADAHGHAGASGGRT